MQERCIFYKEGVLNDRFPCSGKMTRHHVHFKSEGGSSKPNNLVPMCEGHQKFVHSKDKWGNEDFSYLKRLKGQNERN